MLLQGDCLTQLQNLEANSVDSIVTDPPYGLGFMGKQWDSLPPGQEVFEQCLRVLKPGGHLLCFGGSRTYHRMAVAVEDAGFEIRDQIMWVYGSGFPKSQDISKEIDKANGNPNRLQEFVEWMRTTGLTAKHINSIIEKSDVGSHYLRKDQPAIPTPELWEKLKPHIPIEIPKWVDDLVERIAAEREVVGKAKGAQSQSTGRYGSWGNDIDGDGKSEYSITNPSTNPAKQWEGYGTALKPAHEPIVLARKPIEKGLSIAQNCLKWGVGAINVDGCRVEYQSESDKKYGHSGSESAKRGNDTSYSPPCSTSRKDPSQGRFPANLIHDGSPEVVGLFPVTKSGALQPHHNGGNLESGSNTYGKFYRRTVGEKCGNTSFGGDTGSAARFFYSPKAKKKERLTFNNHPTVKPVSLMQYLVRLITPAGGTCLDPFAGSGTTGLACMKEARGYILIDADSQSLDIARRRLLSEIASQEWPLRNYKLI